MVTASSRARALKTSRKAAVAVTLAFPAGMLGSSIGSPDGLGSVGRYGGLRGARFRELTTHLQAQGR